MFSKFTEEPLLSTRYNADHLNSTCKIRISKIYIFLVKLLGEHSNMLFKVYALSTIVRSGY